MLDYKELTSEVCRVVEATGVFIAKEREGFSTSAIEEKGKASLVSYVDKTAEQQLVSALENMLPEAGFIAEEGTSDKVGDRYQWIIDPLDGTTNFIHGIAPYSVSVALREGDEIVLGVVYEVTQKEMFCAWKGSKTYLNGKEIQVATAIDEKDTLVATGLPYYNFDKMEDYMKVLTHFMRTTRGVRRLGSAAADLAYVAAGRFDAFFEHALQPWDVAAGILLVKQAGGKVTDFSGGDNCLFGEQIVAGSANFFPVFHEVVKKHLGED